MASHLAEFRYIFRRTLALLGIICLLLTLGAWIWLQPAMQPETVTQGRIVRIVSPPPEKIVNVLSPYGPGFEHELVSRFSARHGLEPVWLTADSREEALALLLAGKADLAAGFGNDEGVAMLPPPGIKAGKNYAHFKAIRVEGAEIAQFQTLNDEEDDNVQDILEYPIFSPAMHLAGSQDTVLLDPPSYSLWLPMLANTRREMLHNTVVPYRWFWREEDAFFAEKFKDFWESPLREGQLSQLTERYYGFMPKRVIPEDILDLWDAMRHRLPTYSEMIFAAAEETGVPPLLLTAVIYRESRFNPDAVSATKVRGIMQLTTATAQMLGVDRTDAAQCIMGGARYLRSIWESLEDKNLDGWDRWFFTLAAFNQGPGSLNGAMRISRELGDSGTTWTELKKAYPRLRNSRGREAVAFVDNVRYYYYILHGLIALSPTKMEHLAPFLNTGGL